MTNRKHVKSHIGIKIYSAIVSSLLIAAIILTTVGFSTGWWQIAPKDEPVQEQPTPDTTIEEETGLVIGDTEESGVSLMSTKIDSADYAAYGISSATETAYSLTATIVPENATNKAVNWAVEWVNNDSSWATGKNVTEYVKVTPTYDGSLTATLEALKGFGEQIKVVVTSRSNPSASAECILDYARRITDIALWSDKLNDYVLNFDSNEILLDLEIPNFQNFNKALSGGTIWAGNNLIVLDEGLQITDDELADPEQAWADESISKTFRFSDYTIKDNLITEPTGGSEYYAQIDKVITVNSDIASIYSSFVSEGSQRIYMFNEIFPDNSFNAGNNPFAIYFNLKQIQVNFNFTEELYNKYMGEFVTWLQENPDTPIMTATYTIKGKYSTFTKTYTFRYSPDSVEMPVFDVNVNETNKVL